MVRVVTKLSLLALLLSLIVNAYACEKFHDVPSENITAKGHFECDTDTDCALINADCCGCTSGGKQKAVHNSVAKGMLASMKQACADTMCIKMISQDESCKKSAACVEGRCILH